LHLAVSLVSLFDLRPAELGVLRVDEGRLYVGNVKRNARTLKVVKPERRALPLDLPGREVEGTKAMALLRSGLVKLPGAIRTQAAEGAGGFSAQISRFQHILPRCTVQINCSGSGLTFTRRPHLRPPPISTAQNRNHLLLAVDAKPVGFLLTQATEFGPVILKLSGKFLLSND
jgi:hypothetical protein